MPIIEPGKIKENMKPGQRLMGLDLGTKTIGIAFADPGFTIATPRETLKRKKFTEDANKLIAMIEAENVGGIILGLPLNMDGSEGPRCQSSRQFAANFLGKFDLPLAFWDERLSTAAVTRTLIEADTSRKKRAEVVDKLAAGYILQGMLDSL